MLNTRLSVIDENVAGKWPDCMCSSL